jgi:hypothetical protein
MPYYRLYHLDKAGHIAKPPDGFTSKNDEVAIARAMLLVAGKDVELWQLDRLVVRLQAPNKLL